MLYLLNDAVKRTRKNLNMTQKELGDYLRVSGQFVSNCDRNVCTYPVDHFNDLADVLGMNINKLIQLHLADYKSRVIEELSSE